MNEPIISVCIITYNSSATILETLDSIKNQTYPAMELIVSDDCSRDNTTELVEKWISDNKARFATAKLITAEQNHGTAVNLDIAIRNATGEWIKILAGDDLLTENCLSSFFEATKNNSGAFYISDIEPFSENGFVPDSIKNIYAWFFHCANYSIKKKIRHNLFKLELAGPSFFFSREHYLSLFTEQPQYTMLDEWPPVIKTLLSGKNIIPVHQKLVKYRIATASLSHQNKAIGNKRMLLDNKRFFNDFLKHELLKRGMIFHVLNQKIYYAVREKQFSIFERTGTVNSQIFRLYQLLPLSLCYKLKQIMWCKFHKE